MNGLVKILGLTAIGLGAALMARALPVSQINLDEPSEKVALTQTAKINVEIDKLVAELSERSLFVSKSDSVIIGAELTPKLESVDWSPLDYQLIGVSVSQNRKTGWFKNNDDGRLISARQGTEIGSWKLERLTRTQARLKNGTESISLKLFSGADPR